MFFGCLVGFLIVYFSPNWNCTAEKTLFFAQTLVEIDTPTSPKPY